MKNTKKQGDVGLGQAIGYFTSLGYTVCVPLTDNQCYDLIVDSDDFDRPLRVEIKTSTFKERDYYSVNLSVKGGNRSGTGKIKKFDKTKVDYLYVVTPEWQYCIPSEVITGKYKLLLNKKFIEYRISNYRKLF